MDITEFLRRQLTVLTEAALEGSSPEMWYQVELTITPYPAGQSMQKRTQYYRRAYLNRGELSSIQQSLHASSAATSSSTPE